MLPLFGERTHPFQCGENGNGNNFKKKSDRAAIANEKSNNDAVLMSREDEGNNNKKRCFTRDGDDLYLADTGAYCHMIQGDRGMFDCKVINEKITLGNGEIVAIKQGKEGSDHLSTGWAHNAGCIDKCEKFACSGPVQLILDHGSFGQRFDVGNECNNMRLQKICYRNIVSVSNISFLMESLSLVHLRRYQKQRRLYLQ